MIYAARRGAIRALPILLAGSQQDTWVTESGPPARSAGVRPTPVERYPIIDITGKDMQLFLQTLPVQRRLTSRSCRLGKVDNCRGSRSDVGGL